MRRLLIAALMTVYLVTPAVHAGVANGSFSVNIRLNESASGICISSSQSQQTNAWVKVTCQGQQFVSIEPRAGQPFVGTHGGAHRMMVHRFGSQRTRLDRAEGFAHQRNAIDDWTGSGTITGLRVLDLTEKDERLELLVSF
jgi:hypothetical protein